MSFYEPASSLWPGRKLLPASRVIHVYKITDTIGSAPRLPVPGPSNRNHGPATQGLAHKPWFSFSEDARPLRAYRQQGVGS